MLFDLFLINLITCESTLILRLKSSIKNIARGGAQCEALSSISRTAGSAGGDGVCLTRGDSVPL